MQTYKIGDFSVEFDRTATEEWYGTYEGWDCPCGDCRNFLAVVGQSGLPSAVMTLLPVFGVLPERPTYVCELCPTEQGHLYQFNYRVVGRVRSQPHPQESARFDWGSVHCGVESDPCGGPDFPEPYFDLMFVVELPWILEESEK